MMTTTTRRARSRRSPATEADELARDRVRSGSPTSCARSTPDDWAKPTDCPLWDVRAMAGHSVGMMATFTGVPEPDPRDARGDEGGEGERRADDRRA